MNSSELGSVPGLREFGGSLLSAISRRSTLQTIPIGTIVPGVVDELTIAFFNRGHHVSRLQRSSVQAVSLVPKSHDSLFRPFPLHV